MKATAKQIAEIAKLSKQCSSNGSGLKVCIFRNGMAELQSGPEYSGYRQADGSAIWPILKIAYPATRAAIAELLASL